MKTLCKSVAFCCISLASRGWTQELLQLDGGTVERPQNLTVESDVPDAVHNDQVGLPQKKSKAEGREQISAPKALQVTPLAPAATQAVTAQWEMTAHSNVQLPLSLVVVKADAEESVVKEVLATYWRGIQTDKLQDALTTQLASKKVPAVSATIQMSQSHTFSAGFPEGKYSIFLATAAPSTATSPLKADFEVKAETTPAELTITTPSNGEVLSPPVNITVTATGLSSGEMLTAKLTQPSIPDIIKDFDPAQGLKLDLSDGEYSLVVSRSSRPDEASKAVTFSVKSTPAVQPAITLTSPVDGVKLAQGMIPITWKTTGKTPEDENTSFSISIAKTGTPEATGSKTKGTQYEEQLSSGTYTVTVTRPGYASATVNFEVEGGNGLLYGALGLVAAGGGVLALRNMKPKRRPVNDAQDTEESE